MRLGRGGQCICTVKIVTSVTRTTRYVCCRNGGSPVPTRVAAEVSRRFRNVFATCLGRSALGRHRSVQPERPVASRPAPADHGLRDSFGTWVYETYGVKQAQEWLGHSDPATTLRHYVRPTTAARAKAVAGLDEVTRAALEGAERRAVEDAQPALDNVVSLASRRS